MIKYLVCCDFATLKCDIKQFASFLKGYTDDYENLNNNVWLVNIDDESEPFYNDLSNLVHDMESKGYADKDSVVFVAKYKSLDYRLFVMDESIHVD